MGFYLGQLLWPDWDFTSERALYRLLAPSFRDPALEQTVTNKEIDDSKYCGCWIVVGWEAGSSLRYRIGIRSNSSIYVTIPASPLTPQFKRILFFMSVWVFPLSRGWWTRSKRGSHLSVSRVSTVGHGILRIRSTCRSVWKLCSEWQRSFRHFLGPGTVQCRSVDIPGISRQADSYLTTLRSYGYDEIICLSKVARLFPDPIGEEANKGGDDHCI